MVPGTHSPVMCEELYGLIPYERVVDFIDVEEGKLKAPIIALRNNSGREFGEGYVIDANTDVCLQEIVGNRIYFLQNDGTEVRKGDRVAYVVTSKLEARSVKSQCDGLLFIVDMPWASPRKALLVVVKNGYRRTPIRKSP